MNILAKHCSDMNSPYCPCILAEVNRCVICSHLQGSLNCSCNWNGTCILYEKHWTSKNHSPITKRAEEITIFDSIEMIGENTLAGTFQLSDKLAHSLNRMGSFVFLRRQNDEPFYHFPVGIMSVDKTSVTVAIEAIGTKSNRLLDNTSANLVVRGPYYNGLLGQSWLTALKKKRAVLIAGGIGQAPSLPIAKELVRGDNDITAILAGGKVGRIFVAEEFRRLGIKVFEVGSLRREGIPLLRKILKKGVDFIVSCGSDNQHCGIISVLNEMNIDLPMAATNNAVMCCGEGICGSCLHKTTDGDIVRLCKVQTDFRRLEQY